MGLELFEETSNGRLVPLAKHRVKISQDLWRICFEIILAGYSYRKETLGEEEVVFRLPRVEQILDFVKMQKYPTRDWIDVTLQLLAKDSRGKACAIDFEFIYEPPQN